MFEQYSYKQKCIALIVLFCLLSATAWKRSFGPLYQLIVENRNLAAENRNVNKKTGSFAELTADNQKLDRIIGKEGVSKEKIQQEIVNFVEQNSDASINELQPVHTFSDANFRIVTNQLDITGNANSLLRLGYDFEKNFRYSRVVSLNFYTTQKNNDTKQLHLKIIFQNYENNK